MVRTAMHREKSKVILFGTDGVFHGEGEVLTTVIDTVYTLVRNGRHYRYNGMKSGKLGFVEIPQPYCLTEF